MNDEVASSSAALTPASPRENDSATQRDDEVVGGEMDAEEERSKIASKKAANLKDLIRTLDILIYTQLATLYYLEYVLASTPFTRGSADTHAS
jgi:hypothetical protein